MTKKETYKFLRELCKAYNVKVGFNTFTKEYDGQCATTGKKIFINKKITKKRLAETVFHELGHVYCIRNGVFKEFHDSYNYPAELIFEAENWVEWWAKKNWDACGMRKLFGHYEFYYSKKDKSKVIKWIKENY